MFIKIINIKTGFIHVYPFYFEADEVMPYDILYKSKASVTEISKNILL